MELKYADFSTGDLSRTYIANVNHFPDTCPICHHGITPYKSVAYNNSVGDIHYIEALFRCPKVNCQRLFLARFQENSGGRTEWFLKDVNPKQFVLKEFEDEIKGISTEFCQIYNQAKEAQERNLNYIAGMGYRKALEFLIKDYLINFEGKDRSVIEHKMLGKCISEEVTDTNIKQIAQRATWLGNDETHYVRRWADKDINDLIALIDVTVYWISSQIKTRNIIQEMN